MEEELAHSNFSAKVLNDPNRLKRKELPLSKLKSGYYPDTAEGRAAKRAKIESTCLFLSGLEASLTLLEKDREHKEKVSKMKVDS